MQQKNEKLISGRYLLKELKKCKRVIAYQTLEVHSLTQGVRGFLQSPESSAFFRYLRSEKSEFWTVLYQASTSNKQIDTIKDTMNNCWLVGTFVLLKWRDLSRQKSQNIFYVCISLKDEISFILLRKLRTLVTASTKSIR